MGGAVTKENHQNLPNVIIPKPPDIFYQFQRSSEELKTSEQVSGGGRRGKKNSGLVLGLMKEKKRRKNSYVLK